MNKPSLKSTRDRICGKPIGSITIASVLVFLSTSGGLKLIDKFLPGCTDHTEQIERIENKLDTIIEYYRRASP